MYLQSSCQFPITTSGLCSWSFSGSCPFWQGCCWVRAAGCCVCRAAAPAFGQALCQSCAAPGCCCHLWGRRRNTRMTNPPPQCHTLHLPLPFFMPSSLSPFCSRNGLTQVISQVTIFSSAYISEKRPFHSPQHSRSRAPHTPCSWLDANPHWQWLLWVAWSSRCLAQLSHNKVQTQSTYKYTFEKSLLGARARYKALGNFYFFFLIKKGLLKDFTAFKHLSFSNWLIKEHSCLLAVPLQKIVLQKHVDWAVVKCSLI